MFTPPKTKNQKPKTKTSKKNSKNELTETFTQPRDDEHMAVEIENLLLLKIYHERLEYTINNSNKKKN